MDAIPDGSSACQFPKGHRFVKADTASSSPNSQTPIGYATRIKEHADRAANIDIYSGVNYRALANFLIKPYTEQHSRARTEVVDSSSPSLVCVHGVVEDCRPTKKLYRSASDHREFTADPPSLVNNAAHLTWLSGFPAPEWLNAIGAQYRVDPEFFRRHLVFLQSKDNYYTSAMPSSTQRMLTIPLTTIFRRPIVLSRPAIEQARNDAADLVRRHQQKLQVGDSIEIAVYVERSRQHNGWVAVICSDLGKNLTKGPPGPWHSNRPGVVPSCEPVLMYVPKLALKGPPRPRASSSAHVNSAGQMSQNACLLAETFALPSASDVLRFDIRDTLHDIFAFAAAAECQFLTTMQELVDRELQVQSSGIRTEWTLSNLRYFKSAIDGHIVNLENMVAFLRRSDLPRWSPTPRSPRPPFGEDSQPPLSPRGFNGEQSPSRLPCLADDFAHLLQRATKLSHRCVENTTILMNTAMLEESKKAITQADGLRRLTLLTFFFLPLSLTTSFFGMNFQEFGTGKLSIWVCFVFAIPFMSFSTMLCFWDSIHPKFEQRLRRRRQDCAVQTI